MARHPSRVPVVHLRSILAGSVIARLGDAIGRELQSTARRNAYAAVLADRQAAKDRAAAWSSLGGAPGAEPIVRGAA